MTVISHPLRFAAAGLASGRPLRSAVISRPLQFAAIGRVAGASARTRSNDNKVKWADVGWLCGGFAIRCSLYFYRRRALALCGRTPFKTKDEG